MLLEVDNYIQTSDHWNQELTELRQILLNCGLTEAFKWRTPCYMYNNTNVILLGTFKECCFISFIKGVLLKDEERLLVKAGENSQAGKLMKFFDLDSLQKNAEHIKAYVYEAIEIERLGLKAPKLDHSKIELVAELEAKLADDKAFKEAFEALTPGRQRAYNIYFSGAKQASTRMGRIEKYKARILDGYGFHDCTCGFSKKMPSCDGSHKHLK